MEKEIKQCATQHSPSSGLSRSGFPPNVKFKVEDNCLHLFKFSEVREFCGTNWICTDSNGNIFIPHFANDFMDLETITIPNDIIYDKETDSLIRKDLPKESETQKLFDECESIIGDRGQDYGEAKESFSRIAGFWSAYLKIEVAAKDVALMLSLFKIAREQGKPKRDNIVDGINYLALSEQL